MSESIRLNGVFDMQRLNTAIREKGFPCNVKVSGAKRSLPQNAMLHMWCEQIARFFVSHGKTTFADGKPITMESMKTNLKRTFLGEQENSDIDLKSGEITKRFEVRHSSDLDSGEMHAFLTQIDKWAAEYGIPLTHPEDSEYMRMARELGEAA